MDDRARYAGMLPQVDAEASKYSRGSVLVVGGSARYTGAPVMAAQASARTGAGYTSVLVPGAAAGVARAHLLSIPVIPYGGPEQDSLDEGALDGVLSLRHLDALVLGPGMGASERTAALCREAFGRVDAPIVADADALNCISGLHCQEDRRRWNSVAYALKRREAPTVLTPHDGELVRLAAATGVEVEGKDRAELAAAVSEALGCVVVAKGHVTQVAAGGEVHAVDNATPALAKAGTGDVLAGMVGALVAQGLEPADAAELAVYLHGSAGKLAEAELGTLSVMAEDVIERIASAIVELQAAGEAAAGNVPDGPDGDRNPATTKGNVHPC